MLKIYHNPRCSKSREGLQLLEQCTTDFEIVKYMDTPPTETELRDILKLLGKKPIELVRTKETLWKEKYQHKKMTPGQIIKAMVKYPQLIERPIVINNDKAVIARPTESIKNIL